MSGDGFPVFQFLLAALPGIALGWLLRWLLHRAWLKRDGQVETPNERLIYMFGTFTQSLAAGLSLTFLVALVAGTRLSDPRQMAGLTFAVAVVTGFLAAFLRELFRRLSNTDF
jgi:putative flippase GtrA